MIVGLEVNSDGSINLTLKEKKNAVPALIDAGFNDVEIARMVGLERHTVSKIRNESIQGGFIAEVSKIKKPKTEEEQCADTAVAIARHIQKFGAEVIRTAIKSLPPHLQEDVRRAVLDEDGE